MARYFKYKTPDDVVADARELGHSLSMADQFSALFQPIQVGRHTAGSRLAIQPMEGCDGTTDGHPDELTYRRYQRFGTGGAKLIWGEATAIVPEARMNPRQLVISDQTASDLERILTTCRESHQSEFGSDSDLVVGLQLTHSGRFSFQKPLIATHDPILDPLTVDKSTGKHIDSSYPLLSDDDFHQIEDQYLAAAKLAAKIGFDFVDLKQCHRYLLSELLAAKNRPGEYGGSLENRTRLIRNVIQKVRAEVPELTLASRMNVYDGIPYRKNPETNVGEPAEHELPIQASFGTDPNDHQVEVMDEPVQVAQWLKEWGIELINISMGNPYANPHLVRPAEFAPVDGYLAPEHPLLGVLRHFRLTKTIQEAVGDTPVMGSGYSWLQDFAMHAAAANVEAGDVSIIGMGRATLSHPDFAATLKREGKMNRKQICRTFSYCTNLMRTKDHPLGQYETGCPPFDKDVYGPVWDEVKAKSEK